MTNIKQALEAEAERIVSAHRESGDNIHDLIAKHASDHGYEPDVVRSLSWLVNRNNFKSAMAIDHKDEFQIADAETVIHRMHAPKAAATIKSAALSPLILDNQIGLSSGQSSYSEKPQDYGPYLRNKLAARLMELDGTISQSSAIVRRELQTMQRLGESIKRAGLEQSDLFRTRMFGDLSESGSLLVDTVLDNVKVASVPFTNQQLRMYIGRATEDAKGMAAKAASVISEGANITDAVERRERVLAQMTELKKGLVR